MTRQTRRPKYYKHSMIGSESTNSTKIEAVCDTLSTSSSEATDYIITNSFPLCAHVIMVYNMFVMRTTYNYYSASQSGLVIYKT